MTTSSSQSKFQIHDLTHPLTPNTPIYPGDPPFIKSPITTPISSNHIITVHQLGLGTHTGTHIDAPSHFLPSSSSSPCSCCSSPKPSETSIDPNPNPNPNLNMNDNDDECRCSRSTIDQVPLSSLLGPALVIDLTPLQPRPHQRLTWSLIEPLLKNSNPITPRTITYFYIGWYEKWGTQSYFDHPFFDPNVASELLQRGIRVMGTDTLSPDETLLEGDGEYGFGFHENFLGAGGIIAENVNNLKPLIGLENIFTAILPLKLVGCDGSPVRAVAWQK